ncbi:hypothetical protein [Pseudomonas sp.]|uniref:hypothetical protein n=1 Tax=Pseudomonas sp. TaxID=306 RepID=UPI00258F6338|nr:hypothetical protein [Pseudomonas sp.]
MNNHAQTYLEIYRAEKARNHREDLLDLMTVLAIGIGLAAALVYWWAYQLA